jgi:hypothetical protein
LVYGGRKRAPHASQREDRDTQDEDAPVAKAVAQGAAHQDQRGQQQRVSLDYPLGFREGGSEIDLDRRQRHVGHSSIDKSHARTYDGRGENPTFRDHDIRVIVSSKR